MDLINNLNLNTILETLERHLHPEHKLDLETGIYSSICSWCETPFERQIYDFCYFPINLTTCDNRNCRQKASKSKMILIKAFEDIGNKTADIIELKEKINSTYRHQYSVERLERIIRATFVATTTDGKTYSLLIK